MEKPTSNDLTWIDQELAGSAFRDERLGKRLRKIVTQLDKAVGEPIPLACAPRKAHRSAAGGKPYGPPRWQVVFGAGVNSLHKRIRPFGFAVGQDGDTAGHALCCAQSEEQLDMQTLHRARDQAVP